jgi:flagellar M-ring protein FliF
MFVINRFTGPAMTPLYGSLESNDSHQIVTLLQQRGVPYEIANNGSQISVPSDQVASLRMSLASDGLPGSGTLPGNELFDNTSALGATNFLQNVNLRRALEGELSRTIKSLQLVHSARVHLVLPQRQLFSRDKQEATASVVLKLRAAGRLAGEQIASIQHLVAAAVPELNPDRVSIIDDRGNLLARGNEKDGPNDRIRNIEDRQLGFERRKAQEITELLEKKVGVGKVKVTVNADLDFDRISTTEEIFDPDGQVVRSTNTTEQTSQSQENQAGNAISVATNLPDGVGQDGGPSSNTRETRTEETTNFDISKRIVSHEREAGVIRRLTVAVLVDGVTEMVRGDPVYKDRTPEEMQQLAKLVTASAGINQQRGDTVEVINMRFAPIDVEVEEPLELFFGFGKNELLRIAEVFVLAILGILVILLVVRPLVARAFEALPAAAAAAEQKLLEEQAAAAALAGPSEGPPQVEDQFEELIDIDRVEGRVRASSVKKVGEIVEKHPEEALSIIRNWLYQEG